MKILYIQCNMGAAGDMLTAALSELVPDSQAFLAQMNAAGIPGMRMRLEEKTSCGLKGSHISVKIHGEEEISDDVGENCALEEAAHTHHSSEHVHHHAGLREVQALIDALALPEKVKADAMGVYALIAVAEAHAHGCAEDQVHFHELGMLDAVTDVCAVCLLMDMIRPERVVVSPVCTGFGQVRCMHGIVPVPAPATAYLLKGMPVYAGNIRGELLTPTGAALLKYFATEFGQMPQMKILGVGCGMGMKDFEAANCVRVFWGETPDTGRDAVVELNCNLDDMTGEALAFASEELMAQGALDVYLAPIQMKKGRPGIKLSCLCAEVDVERMAALILRHTTTLGVRMTRMERIVMDRQSAMVDTPYGKMSVKKSSGAGVHRCKTEYEDAARTARANGISFMEAAGAALRATEE